MMDDQGLSELPNRSIGIVFPFCHLRPELTAVENVTIPYGIANGRPTANAGNKAEERKH